MPDKPTPKLELVQGGKQEEKSEKTKPEYSTDLEQEKDELKKAESFGRGEMMDFLERKRKEFSDMLDKLQQEEFDVEKEQVEPDFEDIWELYNSWKNFELKLKKYKEDDLQKIEYDSIVFNLKLLLNKTEDWQIRRASFFVRHGEGPPKSEKEEKEKIKNFANIYNRWNKIKETLKSLKTKTGQNRADTIRSAILYPIMEDFIYIYEDSHEEAFRFVLDHFEDFDEDEQKKLFNWFGLSPVNTDKYLKLTDKDFAAFKERLKEYKQTKWVGEMLKSNAHNMYDLLSLINQHVDRVVVERSFRNRSEYSKAYLIHEIMEEIRNSNPELLLGIPGAVEGYKKRSAEKAKMKLSKTGGHKLTRKVGNFNLRQFVIEQISETRDKVFTELEISQIKVRPPIASVNWIDLVWKAEIIDPDYIFRIPLKGPKGTTKIKTITGLDVIHCIEKMPLGESDLNILPSEDEIDPERIKEEQKYLDIKFLTEIKQAAREIIG